MASIYTSYSKSMFTYASSDARYSSQYPFKIRLQSTISDNSPIGIWITRAGFIPNPIARA